MVSCCVCFMGYDEVEHRPKVLPCGHTFCLQCLLTLEAAKSGPIICPKCKTQVPKRGAAKFSDNFDLLEDIQVKKLESDRRFFCVDCETEATSACLDSHTLRGMAGHRKEQLKERKEVVAELKQRALEALENCVQLECEDLVGQELQLLSCQQPVTLSSDAWRAEAVELQERPALRMAMLLLLQEGQLQRRVETEESQTRQLQPKKKKQPPKQKANDVVIVGEKTVPPRRTSPAAAYVDLNLLELTTSNSERFVEEKAAVLECGPVSVLTNVHCPFDPAWVLSALQRHASTLQELHFYAVTRDHLLQVTRMPLLRRLFIRDYHRVQHAPSAASWDLPVAWQGQLLHLEVRALPKETILAIVRAHRDNLQGLVLHLPASQCSEGRYDIWPNSWRNLHLTLQECALQRLNSLKLCRSSCGSFCEEICSRQLIALRNALPGCDVECDKCRS